MHVAIPWSLPVTIPPLKLLPSYQSLVTLANLLKLCSPRSKSPRRRLICLLIAMLPNCSEQPKRTLSDPLSQSSFKTTQQRENETWCQCLPTTGPYWFHTNENDKDSCSYDSNPNYKQQRQKKKTQTAQEPPPQQEQEQEQQTQEQEPVQEQSSKKE